MSYEGIPESVVIDGVRYRFVMDPNIKPDPERKDQNYQEDGEFDASTQEIRIRPGMGEDYARHIVTHECLHGMWEHAGLTAAGGPLELIEEQVVTALAWRLVAFLRANPQLIAYLTRSA